MLERTRGAFAVRAGLKGLEGCPRALRGGQQSCERIPAQVSEEEQERKLDPLLGDDVGESPPESLGTTAHGWSGSKGGERKRKSRRRRAEERSRVVPSRARTS